MKTKVYLMLTLISCAFVRAQEIKTNAGTFVKPTTGDIIFEVSFAPDLIGGGIFSLPMLNQDMGIWGIKARKFIGDKKAIRAIANISVSNSGQKDAETYFTAAAGFGIENHLKGAERLSTYWGYEGNLGYVKGNTVRTISIEDVDVVVNENKIGAGANAFTGFDYYIMPNIYLGLEVAYGVAVTSTKPEGGKNVTKIELAPGVTPFLRLGWKL